MTNESSTATWDKTSHSVLVSHFESADRAELAVADLMAEGLSEQDFSLLKLRETHAVDHVDALEHVVAAFPNKNSNLSDQTEGSADRESEIGGGIATTSADDDVSAAQEMDDSESAAEDLMYSAEDHSIADEQVRDVKIGAETGFFETIRQGHRHARPAEGTIQSMDLPGLGELVGEGSFGSSLLDMVYKEHDTSLAWLAAQINRREGEVGVSIGKSGALLAIDVSAQSPNPDRIEEVLLDRGAGWVRTL